MESFRLPEDRLRTATSAPVVRPLGNSLKILAIIRQVYGSREHHIRTLLTDLMNRVGENWLNATLGSFVGERTLKVGTWVLIALQVIFVPEEPL